MVNYKNGKIYKIVCNETNEIYIGSTTQTLTDRLCQHVSKFKHNNPRACMFKNDQKEFLDKFIKENKCKIARDPIYQYLKKNHPEYKISRRQVMGYIRTNQHK
mmetsp:Transcript_32665/g.38319  ORF Transcript_32665/g.38319 Transcript_32665/m.38319 type:complete len:103 (+) Transcript_32665:95-403(+)